MFKTSNYLNHRRRFTLCYYSILKMSSKCKIAICQITASNNKAENLEIIKNLIRQAVENGAKIVFLPECADYLAHNKNESKELSEPLNGSLMDNYKSIAAVNHIWLSIGGFHERFETNNEVKLRNCHVLIDDTGTIKSVYRKLHMFDAFLPEKNLRQSESEYTIPGQEIVEPVETPIGLLALGICYDLRFPEMSTLQRKMGASVLTYPSAFTASTGEAHWETLLRARAIENQCYVVASAQYGKHNDKRSSFGQSMIVDPWGKIIAQCPHFDHKTERNESIAIATIDQDLIKKVRSEMPVFEHRRNDIYSLINLKAMSNCGEIDGGHYKFADKIIPTSTVFYRSKYSFAFTNIKCVVPGHVLVCSLRVALRLESLTQEEISDFFQTVVKVQKVMELVHNADSSTICVQDGQYAGQTMPHVHCHILPRKPGDFKRNDDIYMQLAKHDRDNTSSDGFRHLQEMSVEAETLRPYFIN